MNTAKKVALLSGLVLLVIALKSPHSAAHDMHNLALFLRDVWNGI